MKTIVHEIDKDGFIKERYVAMVIHGIILDADKQGFISIDPPHGLFKAKWTGLEWVEGATQEEINEITKPIEQPLTDMEILGQQMTERELEAMVQGQQITDLELRMITLEMGEN